MWLFIIFLNEHVLEAVVWRCSAKRYSLNFAKFTAKNLCLQPATLFKKRLFEFHEALKNNFFNRKPPVAYLTPLKEGRGKHDAGAGLLKRGVVVALFVFSFFKVYHFYI